MTKAKSQETGKTYKVGYCKPPVNRQFGKKGGNPQGHGFFKAEDTARAKLEKLITLPKDDLIVVKKDTSASKFERDLADIILDESLKPADKWKIIREVIDEVYGMPKQQIEQTNIEPPKPLSPRKQKKDK